MNAAFLNEFDALVSPEVEAGECEHTYIAVDDWMGDPTLINGTADCSYMECTECGHTRDITDDDMLQFQDEVQRARYEERQDWQ